MSWATRENDCYAWLDRWTYEHRKELLYQLMTVSLVALQIHLNYTAYKKDMSRIYRSVKRMQYC